MLTKRHGQRTDTLIMLDLNLFISIIGGLILRVAIPLGATLLLGYFIRRLDESWKAKSESTKLNLVELVKNRVVPICWEYMNCPPSIQGICPVHGQKDLICWEYFGSDGVIRPGCKNCAYRQTYYPLSEAQV